MRSKPILFVALLAIAATGCQSTFGPQIGMTEKQWLRRTLIADVAYMEGSVKAYRSGGAYYYFREGVLVKIDQGVIPAHRIEMEIRSDQKISTSPSDDIYEELRKLDQLRKEGILSDEEFLAQKKRLLEAKK